MKRKSLIILVALLSLLIAGGALANGTTAVDWWVLGGGVGPGDNNGGEIILDATLGQPVIGSSSAEGVSLGSGYWYGSDSTTSVRLASFQASPSGGGILVSWEMGTHVDVLGFDVYRRSLGSYGLDKLNPSLIPSQDPGGVEGAAYTWTDTDVQAGLTYTYFLEEVDIGSLRTRYGPVEATAMYAVFLP